MIFSLRLYRIKRKSMFSFLSWLSKYSNSPVKIPLISLYCSSSSPSIFMANSTETLFLAEQTTSSVMLNIKPNQNLILDLDSPKYTYSLKSMIECLHYSPLVQALTMAENVPMVRLSKAFSTATYQHCEAMITLEVGSHKSLISKARFSKILGFSSTDGLVDPKSISSSLIMEMFY